MTESVLVPRSVVREEPHKPLKTKGPSVRVVVQPVTSHRFRYKSEGRWAGSIPGANKKGYPTIEITGCSAGKAMVVVSCVTKDWPYKTHPHGVVARELYRSEDEVKKGACKVDVELTGQRTQVSFNNIGIHSCKQNEVKDVLRIRKQLGVDPFKNGFDYGSKPKNVNLNALRLCFQVFILDENNCVQQALQPAVTNVIHDKKIQGELSIVRTSHRAGPATGDTDVILLCKKVKPSDTTVVFLERNSEGVVWETTASDLSAHQNVAISFKTPPYRDTGIKKNVKVWLQLKRLSDNARSEPVEFEYTPAPTDKTANILKKHLLEWLQRDPIPMDTELPNTLQQDAYRVHSPLEHMQSPLEQKPAQPWPIDLPPILGPSPQQLQYTPQDMSWMDRSYIQLDQLSHPPAPAPAPIQHAPHLPDYPMTSHSHARNLNPFLCHQQEQYVYVRGDDVPECLHSLSPQYAPSAPDLNAGQSEEMQISSEQFTGILEEQISDHLSGLSLKDLVGGQIQEPKI